MLNAPFTLLPELHISLDGLLQIQDCGVLYYNHSCNQGHKWEIMVGPTATASDGRRGTQEPCQTLSGLRLKSEQGGLMVAPTALGMASECSTNQSL